MAKPDEGEEIARVLAWLHSGREGARPRPEEAKKGHELAALLPRLAPLLGTRRPRTFVEVAAGRGHAALLVARAGLAERVVTIEREAARTDAIVVAASRASVTIDARTGDAGDRALYPDAPTVVLALHACGDASDRAIEAGSAAGARAIVIVPCCVAAALPDARRAEERLAALGMVDRAPMRRRFVDAWTLSTRTLALEAAGYVTDAIEFCSARTTPHNVALIARHAPEPARVARALASLAALRA